MAERLNLALAPADYARLRRVAAYHRLAPGTWARQCVCWQSEDQLNKLVASGALDRFEQVELFGKASHKDKGGKT